MNRLRVFIQTLAAICGVLLAGSGQAQPDGYPSRPVKIVVGFAAGGASDLVARELASQLTQQLKAPFIVENRPGASGAIGAAAAAKAAPDGYTLWLAAGGLALVQALSKAPAFDMDKDFSPVALSATGNYVLVVNPAVPARSVQDLVRYAKENPGKLNYASAGRGTPLHLAGELFKWMTSTDIAHIPFAGDAPALAALMGNTVQIGFLNLPAAIPLIQAGKLRALAVTGRQRSTALPRLPTMIESGFKDFEVQTWWGLMAPAGTPAKVVQALNAALTRICSEPEVKKEFTRLGIEATPSTPEGLDAVIRKDLGQYRKIIKIAGIEPE